jgi:hypothetical protein
MPTDRFDHVFVEPASFDASRVLDGTPIVFEQSA